MDKKVVPVVSATDMQVARLTELGIATMNLVHELNNLIGGISQGVKNIETLAQNIAIDNNHLADMLKIVNNACKHASTLINTTLTYGNSSIDKNSNNLEHLVHDAVNFISIYKNVKQLQYKNKDLFCIISKSRIPLLYCVPQEIQQILINVLKNAIDACLTVEKPQIRIELEYMNNVFLISIIDNGVGMHQEQLAALGSSFATFKDNGHGLGLRICKTILYNNYAGELYIKSEYKIGTEVTIQIKNLIAS